MNLTIVAHLATEGKELPAALALDLEERDCEIDSVFELHNSYINGRRAAERKFALHKMTPQKSQPSLD